MNIELILPENVGGQLNINLLFAVIFNSGVFLCNCAAILNTHHIPARAKIHTYTIELFQLPMNPSGREDDGKCGYDKYSCTQRVWFMV